MQSARTSRRMKLKHLQSALEDVRASHSGSGFAAPIGVCILLSSVAWLVINVRACRAYVAHCVARRLRFTDLECRARIALVRSARSTLPTSCWSSIRRRRTSQHTCCSQFKTRMARLRARPLPTSAVARAFSPSARKSWELGMVAVHHAYLLPCAGSLAVHVV